MPRWNGCCLLAGVALLLQVPGALEGAADGAGPEGVEGLAEARGRGVLGGGDAHVVAAVVLDVEVAVEALGQGDLRQPALVGLALVAELVGGVDADAADGADGGGQADLVEQAELTEPERRALRDDVAGRHEADVLDRQEEVGDPPVVLVLLERLDRVVGRVGAVEAGEQVDGGDDAQHDDGADPEPDPPAGQGPHAGGDERQRRHDEADQPQVALAVAPGLGGVLRHRAVADGVGHRASCVAAGFTEP